MSMPNVHCLEQVDVQLDEFTKPEVAYGQEAQRRLAEFAASPPAGADIVLHFEDGLQIRLSAVPDDGLALITGRDGE